MLFLSFGQLEPTQAPAKKEGVENKRGRDGMGCGAALIMADGVYSSRMRVAAHCIHPYRREYDVSLHTCCTYVKTPLAHLSKPAHVKANLDSVRQRMFAYPSKPAGM